MTLPARLITKLTWTDASDQQEKPDVEKPVFKIDPETEEVVREDKQVRYRRVKRVKLSLPQTPTTPGAKSVDGVDDDSASVITTDDSAAAKWPFEQVALKLQAAVYEISTLSESMRTADTVIMRVERTPLSSQEKLETLELGCAKRTQSFENAEAILRKGVETVDKEIKNQRDYFRKLSKVTRKWRVGCPTHSMTALTSLKSEEPLAIYLEASAGENSDPELVYLRRTEPAAGGITLASKDGSQDVSTEFKAHSIFAEFISASPPFKAKGQASTMLLGKDEPDNTTALPGGIILPVEDGQSIDSLIESRFRDAHARGLMKQLDHRYELRLGDEAILRFELVPEKRSFEIINEFDAICSLALNLLERGKGLGEIHDVCMQKLMFGRYCEALAKVPGAAGITWRHLEDINDQPEMVESRCLIDVGRSAKYAIEFSLLSGKLSMDWCSLPGFRPRIVHNLQPQQALDLATEVSIGAIVREMVNLVDREDKLLVDSIKPDAFRAVAKSNAAFVFSTAVSSVDGNLKVVLTHTDRREEDCSEHPFFSIRRVIANWKSANN